VFATIFIGTQNVMTLLCGLLDRFLEQHMLKKNRIDNEQMSLSILGEAKYKNIFQYVCKHKPGMFSWLFKSHHLVLSDILSQPFNSEMHFDPKIQKF